MKNANENLYVGTILILCIFMSGAVLFARPAHAQASSANGKLSVSFSNICVDTSELESYIEKAKALIADTRISANGANIPPNEFWATEATHNAFRHAIETAQATLRKFTSPLYFDEVSAKIYPVAPGQSFTMTLRIEENTGFANMPLRLFVPEGLELTHVANINLSGMLIAFPQGHVPETGEIDSIIGSAYAFVISAGGSNFSVPDADLLRFTFRATSPATISETAPIRLEFANAQRYSPPTTADGVPLNIQLPGGGVIGSVVITTPGD